MPDQSLLTIVVLLAAAVLLVALARTIRLPPIISYLMVGILLGPHALALVPDEERMRHLAEFGVVFLMFSIGLEFSLAQFMRMRRLVFGLGTAQVLLTAFAFLAVALLIPLPWRTGVTLGGILALSSTAMVVRALAERLETQSRHGRIAISILLFQDLAVIPLLILIPALAGSTANLPHDLAIASGKGAVAVLILLLLGRPLINPWFGWVAARKSNELFMLNLLLVTLALAWVTEAAGLSLALGAFIAGMLLAETAYRYQVEADIASFRDILLGLFFVTIGMMVNVPVLLAYLPWVLFVLLLIFVLKGVIVWAVCRFAGFETGVAIRSAIVLAQAGEFGFVLISLAAQKNLVPSNVLQPVLGAMLLSMLLAPLLVQHNGRIARFFAPGYKKQRQQNLDMVREQDLREQVIICGYGRVGQSIARVLDDEGVPYLALDLDPTRVRQAQAAGESIFYGDAGRRDLLEAAGIAHARAIVITYGNSKQSIRVLAAAKELRPQIPAIVRAHDDSQMEALEAAGADAVIPEVTEGALMLASQTLLQIGFPMSTVLRRVRRFRQERYSLFRGNFWGGSEPGEDQNSPRLYPIALGETAYALGHRLGDLDLERFDVQVAAVRRFGIRGREPSPDTRLRRDDVVVLFGRPEALAEAERFVLNGEQEEKPAKAQEVA
ncbi:monovalent cation:proton antiporter-2 (CPA2) family protein [Candidatus Igneacidithiobacillus taiwanensis]|uniref:monovalent cation:proton antiporter-2 (CPA2) family protein n=1 Tax=Candidatus Igneacidithiobacillus taiwanensis TaxID=1945924 RepID=UPI00289F7EDF|nr:monovalent cation:proton antiporter-2 (CPA2) family protein [Candidatus Igneacidithiobacillus taiwanensis]MCE5361010.1 cation:proton antiporter [Acidithiobacillus sp.]